MEMADLRNLDVSSLKKEILSFKKELFSLKINLSVGQVKDSSQLRKLRQTVARASMVLAEKMKQPATVTVNKTLAPVKKARARKMAVKKTTKEIA